MTLKTLKIQTNAGYLEIGPQNGSYSHFYTDRANFYFNQQVKFDVFCYSYDKTFHTSRIVEIT